MESFFSKLHTRQTVQDFDAASTSTSQTDGLVGKLIWKNSLQQRTNTIVMISFNILSALLIIASISFDASKASKRGLAPRTRYGASVFQKNSLLTVLGISSCLYRTYMLPTHFRWSYQMPSSCKVPYFLRCRALDLVIYTLVIVVQFRR
jgi:hypothetical protein